MSAASIRPETTRRDFLPLLLALIGFVAYMGALPAPFIYDDLKYIVSEPALQHLWPIGGHANRPVLTVSLALNRLVTGMDPTGFRVVNVAIHVAAALFLYGLVRRTLLAPRFRERFGRSSRGPAFAVSALWLLHPLHTQAVTYIWQRSESLMGLFFLGVLYCVARAGEGRRAPLWCSLAVLFCLLGLGTKEVMVAVFPVVLLYDGVLLSPSIREALKRRRWLYAALFLIAIALVAVVLPGTHTSVGRFSRLEYAVSQPGVLLQYLRLAIWPHPLCFDYGLVPSTGWGAILPPALAVLALLAATVWLLWRRSWVGLALAWFFLCLAPTSSVVVINDLMVEYRMYLPLVGLTALFVAGAGFVGRRLGNPVWGWLLLLVAALALGTRTVLRNQDYLSATGLWTTAAEAAPENYRAPYQIGLHLTMKEDHARALPFYRRALALHPRHRESHLNLAISLQETGDLEGAIRHLETALELEPRAKERCMLALILFRAGRFEEAAGQYQRACRANPRLAEAQIGLASSCVRLGRLEEALEASRKATRLEPDSAAAWNHLGQVCLAAGQVTEAATAFERAVRLEPANAVAHCWLGKAQAARGNERESLEHFNEGLRRDPGQALDVAAFAIEASPNAGTSALRLAVRICELAARYAGGKDPEVLANLARGYAAVGRFDLAAKTFQEVLAHPIVEGDAARRQAYQRELNALRAGH